MFAKKDYVHIILKFIVRAEWSGKSKKQKQQKQTNKKTTSYPNEDDESIVLGEFHYPFCTYPGSVCIISCLGYYIVYLSDFSL